MPLDVLRRIEADREVDVNDEGPREGPFVIRSTVIGQSVGPGSVLLQGADLLAGSREVPADGSGGVSG
jgi:hypothetical protein